MVKMSPAILSTLEGIQIHLSIANVDGRWYLECEEAQPMLEHLHKDVDFSGLRDGARIRGVIIPGEGAYFQLFDQYGSVVDDVAQLSETDATERLLDQMVW